MIIARSLSRPAALLALLFTFAAAGARAAPDCEPVEGIESICGLHSPEDIVVAPGGRHLVFGQMSAPGGLFLLDTETHAVAPLFPLAGDAGVGGAADTLWGEPGCTAPPRPLLVHGLDLRQRADRRWQLLAVNHGERESVEFFELTPGPGAPSVAWRGCALAPGDASLNDVAALPEGGFLVTRMTSRESPNWEMVQALLGFDNGLVFRWRREEGFEPLPGTEGRFPNGIVVSPAGDSFFVNMYLGNRVRKFSWPGAEPLGAVVVSKPDNSTWSEDGKLLVASHFGSIMELYDSLHQDPNEPSLLPFAIVEVDPETLERRELLSREGPPMGAGTVAVQRGDALYIGSYVGDRIIRIPLKRSP
jgi:hypothetical protein